MAQGVKHSRPAALGSSLRSQKKSGVGKRVKNAPSKHKKGSPSTLTAAINRNIEALIVQRAGAAGSGFNIVSQSKQTVVKQRRKDLQTVVANRLARKIVSKADAHIADIRKEIIAMETSNDMDL
uniref:Uncharacterized protein n=1 Tax=Spongospora subterranea TaxID=70186 RepID=A0A0H5QLG7_9EUKA|eukprot:CRZ02990.1 hypothetical protein [Spongospora subterranea]